MISCWFTALCLEAFAFGQILEAPPPSYGEDFQGLSDRPETPETVGYGEMPRITESDATVPHLVHTETHIVVPSADPHSHTVIVSHGSHHRGDVYYADATAGQPVPTYHAEAVPQAQPAPARYPHFHESFHGSFGGESYKEDQYHECQGHEEQVSACEDLPECEHCVPVDCMFTQWSEWHLGNHDCLGLQYRHRAINVASNGCGLPCFGDKTESKESSSEECNIPPQDCILSFWGEWSTCQNERDQSIRTRHVETPSRGDGQACMGALSETKPCGGPHPLPCILSQWQPWTTCSASCGPGRHTRLRKIVSEGHVNGDTCDDSLLETDTCQVAECPIRDCQISAWSDWSYCSEGLQRMRHRHILQSPQGIGLICNASLVQTAGCSGKDTHHCEMTEWSAWTTCDRTCHGGQTFRERELMHASAQRTFCRHVKLKETAPCAAHFDLRHFCFLVSFQLGG